MDARAARCVALMTGHGTVLFLGALFVLTSGNVSNDFMHGAYAFSTYSAAGLATAYLALVPWPQKPLFFRLGIPLEIISALLFVLMVVSWIYGLNSGRFDGLHAAG